MEFILYSAIFYMGVTLTQLLKSETSIQYGSRRAQPASTLSEILTQ